MKIRQENLSKNLGLVKTQLKAPTQLICVSKTYPASDIALAYALGERLFGENQVLELAQKSQELAATCPDIQWHMIGHLQSNKIKKLFSVPNLVSLHSVDTLRLIEALMKEEGLLSQKLNIFLQVKTSDEVEKSGFESEEELKVAINLLQQSQKLQFHGLMTMGKIRTDDPKREAKLCFEKLIHIGHKLKIAYPELPLNYSMGMSGDYEIASLMGAHYVRVGSLIFGSRS